MGISNNNSIDCGIVIFNNEKKISRFFQFPPSISEIHSIRVINTKKINSLIKNFYDCLNKNHKVKFIIVFLGMIFAAFLEMLSLSLIPLFIAAIIDLNGLISYLPNFESLLLGYSQKEIIIYGALFLLSIFLFKNILLVFQYYNENNLILHLNKSFAIQLFKNYLSSNYLFYISKNTGYFIRNLTSEVNNSVNLAYGFLILLREGLVTMVIISILIIRSPSITIIFFLILVISTFLFFKIFKLKIKKLVNLLKN